MRTNIFFLSLDIILLACLAAAMDGWDEGAMADSPFGSNSGTSDSGWLDDLPSDQDLHDAMTKHPSRAGFPLYSFRRDQPAWLPSGGQRRHGRSHHYIPQFKRNVEGLMFGPLSIGLDRFQVFNYPHSLPHLQATYSYGNDWTPINFELLRQAELLHTGVWTYRPEPHLLDDIAIAFERWHRFQSRKPERVVGSYGLRHGQFTWPPVEFLTDVHSRRLVMPESAITHLRSEVIGGLESHGADVAHVYHLSLPTAHGTRHIMMTRLDTVMNTNLRRRSKNSDFWLLLETLTTPASWYRLETNRNIYAILGGMFLPKDAPELFKEHMYPVRVNTH